MAKNHGRQHNQPCATRVEATDSVYKKEMDATELESTGLADDTLAADMTGEEMTDTSNEIVDDETMNTDAAMMGLTTADAGDEADTQINQTDTNGGKSKMAEYNNKTTTEQANEPTAATGYAGDATQPVSGQSASESTTNRETGNSNVSETVQETVGQARQAASNLTEQAKQKVTEGVDEAKRQVKSTVDEQKSRTAEQLGGIAGALRQTSVQLQDQDNAMVAQYAQSAAEQIDRFSNYLQTADVGELWRETQNLARRQPELFVAGALAGGFLLARFLKSSGAQSRNYDTGYEPTNRYRNRNEQPHPYKYSTDDAVARMDFESPAPQNIRVAEEV